MNSLPAPGGCTILHNEKWCYVPQSYEDAVLVNMPYEKCNVVLNVEFVSIIHFYTWSALHVILWGISTGDLTLMSPHCNNKNNNNNGIWRHQLPVATKQNCCAKNFTSTVKVKKEFEKTWKHPVGELVHKEKAKAFCVEWTLLQESTRI